MKLLLFIIMAIFIDTRERERRNGMVVGRVSRESHKCSVIILLAIILNLVDVKE